MINDDNTMKSPGPNTKKIPYKPSQKGWQIRQHKRQIPLLHPDSWINIDIPRSWLTIMRNTGLTLAEQFCLAISNYNPKRGVSHSGADLVGVRVKLPGDLAIHYREERQVLLRAIGQYIKSL